MNTKLLLPISLSLNLALVGFGAVAFLEDHDRSSVPEDIKPKSAQATPSVEQKPFSSAPAPEIRSLQWGDLVSSDDATFARNLRGIGCPEATIRYILTAAIGNRYDEQRQALEVERQQGKIDAATYEAALARTWDQQNAQVGQLPSSAAPSSQAAAATSFQPGTTATGSAGAPAGLVSGGVGGGSSATASSHTPVAIPVALTEPPASLGLNDTQKAAAYQIGDRFSNSISSQNLAPTDPAYRQAWQTAQPNADDALKAQIGYQAFVRWQLQAASQAAPQPKK